MSPTRKLPTVPVAPLRYVPSRLAALKAARDGETRWLPITNSAAGLYEQRYAFSGLRRNGVHTFMAVLTMDHPGELEFAGSRLHFVVTAYDPDSVAPALLRCMTLEQYDQWQLNP